MPGAVRNIILQEASRLYESLPSSRGALILHQQRDFEFPDVIFEPGDVNFQQNFLIFEFSFFAKFEFVDQPQSFSLCAPTDFNTCSGR